MAESTDAAKRTVRYEAVVFDCDGLLMDTEGAWEKGEAKLLAGYGHTYTREDRIRLLGVGAADAGRIISDILGQPERSEELLSELHAICRVIVAAEARPMSGAVELLRSLHGNVPLAVASNSPTDLVVGVLEGAGMLGYFDAVLGDHDVENAKPAPDLYLGACKRLGVRPERSLALEDSPTGVRAAKSAGMRVLGIPFEPGVALEAHAIYPSLDDEGVVREVFAAAP
ncbi:HAD family hydrolase [Rubrobacter indicoceani]|uniref:HAD family hydrolase n=1 Tax=Rubrobacter indicoceani TaxID=2051957 RepID=UPI000E5B8CAD|nr:HAD family phosphatase [Rubrobacter indicoceani]